MRLGVRQRHHHVAAQEPDRVLHAALLVARARIAEPDLDPVMRDEPLEHLHHHDPVPRDPGAPRRWRRPGTSTGGTAPMCSNTPSSPTAHALRVLPGQRHRVPHVRIRERRHRQCTSVRLPATTACAKPKSACITPGDHSNSQIPVTGKPMLLPPALHVPLHDPVRTIEPLLLDQPVIHAPGRMPLLARHEPVRLQPLADQRLVRVELRDRRRTGRGLRRAVLQLRVLAHRLSGHPDLLRYATPGHTPRVENPDTLLYGRWHRHVFPSRDTCEWLPHLGNPARPGRANASPRRQHDHMVNFSPITRPTNPR